MGKHMKLRRKIEVDSNVLSGRLPDERICVQNKISMDSSEFDCSEYRIKMKTSSTEALAHQFVTLRSKVKYI